ncbi:MAG: AraC family transcriptional regulator [Muribaculaceae bacterium]|nr:AraC family transcriptional regulator [Muribaculaceae bacterium]
MKSSKQEIITELVPIHDKYGFYAVEREKDSFAYPVHRHDAYEINFLFGCKGARRIVGDSIEELGEVDLVMVGPGIEHGWEMHNCQSSDMREITIQFYQGFFVEDYLKDNKQDSMLRLLRLSANGVAFGLDAMLRCYYLLENVINVENSFDKMYALHKLVYGLSVSKDMRVLSSATFSQAYTSNDSRRITKVQQYIAEHAMEKIRLIELANLAGMTESSFSRFFKLHTGTSVSDYIMTMRLGAAIRRLVDTKMSISEICYECGFNNVSHFSRCFRQMKKCSPSEFRAMYRNKMK